MSVPAPGAKFFHPRWGGSGGSVIKVKRVEQTGGRWGRGYVAWKFSPVADPGWHKSTHRVCCLSTWPDFAKDMVPIVACPKCDGEGRYALKLKGGPYVAEQPFTDGKLPPCDQCDGKGWIPIV